MDNKGFEYCLNHPEIFQEMDVKSVLDWTPRQRGIAKEKLHFWLSDERIKYLKRNCVELEYRPIWSENQYYSGIDEALDTINEALNTIKKEFKILKGY